jgi:hypothetical protein
MCDTYTWQRRSLFIRDKPVFSSERVLHKEHKDYDRNGSGRDSQGAWSQDELIGGKPPVLK